MNYVFSRPVPLEIHKLSSRRIDISYDDGELLTAQSNRFANSSPNLRQPQGKGCGGYSLQPSLDTAPPNR